MCWKALHLIKIPHLPLWPVVRKAVRRSPLACTSRGAAPGSELQIHYEGSFAFCSGDGLVPDQQVAMASFAGMRRQATTLHG